MSPRQRSLRRRQKPPARLISDSGFCAVGNLALYARAPRAAYHWADTTGDVSPRCAGASQSRGRGGPQSGDEKDRGPSDDAACRSLTAPLLDRGASSRSLPNSSACRSTVATDRGI